jgi:hypothetical protein
MGISAVKSYQGAQIFEALGIGEEVIDKYFTSTASRIGGIGLPEIAKEVTSRMEAAYKTAETQPGLPTGGVYQWRKDGEYHMFNPKSIYQLQNAVRKGDYSLFKEFSRSLNEENERLCTIRGLLEFVPSKQPISIYEVEPVESIVKRFKTGAMSYGSISKEAHEALAIAIYSAVKHQDSFEEAVISSVNHSGDSDSTGAVCGNIMGCLLGCEAIPAQFTDRLELKDVLEEMAHDLWTGCIISEHEPVDTPEKKRWEQKYCNKRWSPAQ